MADDQNKQTLGEKIGKLATAGRRQYSEYKERREQQQQERAKRRQEKQQAKEEQRAVNKEGHAQKQKDKADTKAADRLKTIDERVASLVLKDGVRDKSLAGNETPEQKAARKAELDRQTKEIRADIKYKERDAATAERKFKQDIRQIQTKGESSSLKRGTQQIANAARAGVENVAAKAEERIEKVGAKMHPKVEGAKAKIVHASNEVTKKVEDIVDKMKAAYHVIKEGESSREDATQGKGKDNSKNR